MRRLCKNLSRKMFISSGTKKGPKLVFPFLCPSCPDVRAFLYVHTFFRQVMVQRLPSPFSSPFLSVLMVLKKTLVDIGNEVTFRLSALFHCFRHLEKEFYRKSFSISEVFRAWASIISERILK